MKDKYKKTSRTTYIDMLRGIFNRQVDYEFFNAAELFSRLEELRFVSAADLRAALEEMEENGEIVSGEFYKETLYKKVSS